jgi:hypothetical protein
MKAVKKLFGKKKKPLESDKKSEDTKTLDTTGDPTPNRRVTSGGEVPVPETSSNEKDPKQSIIRQVLNSKNKEVEAPKQRPRNTSPRMKSVEPPAGREDFSFKQMPGFCDLPVEDTPDEPAHIARAYDAIPVLEQSKLPRGGVSVETKAVGRVQVGHVFQSPRRTDTLSRIWKISQNPRFPLQFGIPPETIKDSMKLGIPVPQVYIVPVERFSREMGPALGVNLAEFEFPAYFNYFVYKKRCTLVVDSEDAEDNIRRVFSETLLGPAQFRREEGGITYEAEDFAPDFPIEAIPNFQKELKHFRIMPDGHELVIETLLNFRHFELNHDSVQSFGVPPPSKEGDDGKQDEDTAMQEPISDEDVEESVPQDESGVEQREQEQNPWTYTATKDMGKLPF